MEQAEVNAMNATPADVTTELRCDLGRNIDRITILLYGERVAVSNAHPVVGCKSRLAYGDDAA